MVPPLLALLPQLPVVILILMEVLRILAYRMELMAQQVKILKLTVHCSMVLVTVELMVMTPIMVHKTYRSAVV